MPIKNKVRTPNIKRIVCGVVSLMRQFEFPFFSRIRSTLHASTKSAAIPIKTQRIVPGFSEKCEKSAVRVGNDASKGIPAQENKATTKAIELIG